MKMRCIMALCGAMAFVLAGCGSEIVESAVTETQVIDVNEPSAVEQAMESADYEFIDETQPLLDFKKEYENLTAAEEIQNAEDKAYESFYFAALFCSFAHMPLRFLLFPLQVFYQRGSKAAFHLSPHPKQARR